MTRNRILTAVVTLALGVWSTACPFTTGYQKETGSPPSYSLTRMGDAIYRIDLQGLESTTKQGVTLELLKRAARVAQQEGCDYFLVTGGEVLGDNEIRATPFAGLFPESASGSQGEGTARVTQRYTGSVIFRIFKGEKPADNPLAFDVAEFIR